MPYYLQYQDSLYALELHAQGQQRQLSMEEGPKLEAEIVHAQDGFLILRLRQADGSARIVRAAISAEGRQRWVTIEGQTWVFSQSAGRPRRGAAGSASGLLRAPMPGQIRAVPSAEGQTVARGDTLLILEAMKMEIRIQAPFDGHLVQLKVAPGQTVERDEILGEVQPISQGA